MIQMVGMDHKTAPVEIRSIISMTKEEQRSLMRILADADGIEGIVILSTCNRTEIWISTDEETELPLLDLVCAFKKMPRDEYGRFFSVRSKDRAVHHLFYLTCGLRSAILAEDQILTQVKQALSFSREAGFADSVLEVLFRTAVTAAKRVKTEVNFTRANATAIAQALQMLEEEGYYVKGRRCLVIGNGEYGRLTANTLLKKGADVSMTVRQYHSGLVVVPDGCSQVRYSDRFSILSKFDLVVSATSSPHYTLKMEDVSSMRPDHEIILIDLAVPRDIDPEIRELRSFRVFDIDDFATTETNVNDEAYYQADEILSEEIGVFDEWYNSRDLIPHIQGIRENAVTDLNLRMRKIMRRLPLSEKEQDVLFQQMDTAVGKVVSKMIFDLQDYVSEREFRDVILGLEKVYEDD